MKSRPLYRSITFWSGIFVMLFVCVAWWDSTWMLNRVFFRHFQTWHMEGYIAIHYNVLDLHGGVKLERKKLSRLIALPDGFPLAAFHFARGGELPPPSSEEAQSIPLKSNRDWMLAGLNYAPRKSWMLFVPHWLLLLAVALPWSGLLLWRARRHRQAIGKDVAH